MIYEIAFSEWTTRENIERTKNAMTSDILVRLNPATSTVLNTDRLVHVPRIFSMAIMAEMTN